VAPEFVVGTTALQLLPACVQVSDCAEQAAGGGTAHDAAAGALQLPPPQEKLALPVAGDTVSVAMAAPPEAVAATAAEQLCPPTVQLMLCAAQAGGGGTAQLALLGAPQAPSLQLKRASPKVGPSVSLRVAAAPDTVAGAVAEQESAPTLQLKLCEAQAAGDGSAHVALFGLPQLPLLQLKLAVPVAGATKSLTTTDVPLEVSATEAEQLFAPTVQASGCPSQGGVMRAANACSICAALMPASKIT
jgi:hypothetical protein